MARPETDGFVVSADAPRAGRRSSTAEVSVAVRLADGRLVRSDGTVHVTTESGAGMHVPEEWL